MYAQTCVNQTLQADLSGDENLQVHVLRVRYLSASPRSTHAASYRFYRKGPAFVYQPHTDLTVLAAGPGKVCWTLWRVPGADGWFERSARLVQLCLGVKTL